MGVRVLYAEDEQFAVLYDSVTMTAFGPIFTASDDKHDYPVDAAHDFLVWLEPYDARQFTGAALERAYGDWLAGRPNIEEAPADEVIV